MKKGSHKHSWIFEGKSCCYRLKCSLPECERMTTAYYTKGAMPKIGEPVRFTDESNETIEVIGSVVE